jgi:hypothetical protein
MNKQQALSIARSIIDEENISSHELLSCIRFDGRDRDEAVAAFYQELESRLSSEQVAELREVLKGRTLPPPRPYWYVSYIINYGHKLAILAMQIDEATGEITVNDE